MVYETQKTLAEAFREQYDLYKAKKIDKIELKKWYLTIRTHESNRLKMFDVDELFQAGFKAKLGKRRLVLFTEFETEIT